jgi:hypothetical protein
MLRVGVASLDSKEGRNGESSHVRLCNSFGFWQEQNATAISPSSPFNVEYGSIRGSPHYTLLIFFAASGTSSQTGKSITTGPFRLSVVRFSCVIHAALTNNVVLLHSNSNLPSRSSPYPVKSRYQGVTLPSPSPSLFGLSIALTPSISPPSASLLLTISAP